MLLTNNRDHIMNFAIKEETATTVTSPNPLGSYLNAKERSNDAYKLHRKLFDSNSHLDRVEKVCEILQNFFGRPASYFTYRGLGGRKPFENIKMEQVGHILSRTPIAKKNEKLYGPLQALGNVQVISKNGHLIVRVY